MPRRKKLYEGKAKIIYKGPEPDTLVQYFKDDATAFNNKKHAIIEGKGVLNNRISAHVMGFLNEMDIPTHFIRRLNMREQLVHEAEMLPIEVVVRNYAAGSFSKRYKIEEGAKLPRPIIEFCAKADELDDALVSEDHIYAFGWAHPIELEEVHAMALRINDLLCGLFMGVGLRLIDFKLEFGRLYDEDGNIVRIVLADEISPDSCRLWDVETHQKLDKDVFRRELGDLKQAYEEVADRLGILNQNEENGHLPKAARDAANGKKKVSQEK